ncbi:MAG: 4'-phosphopantetheinyl transferase superfamily protein [Bacteriovorax sp.]|nr:4'-phosphopantetheinyl transferase superfamily protein [Bacteriovorax sp.]
MFSSLLNQSEYCHETLESNYIGSSKNESHRRAREKVCLEIRNFFAILFAPLIKLPSGEVRLVDIDWILSISHKEDVAAIALSCDYESIGIDLEYLDNDIDWTTFQGRFFTREDWFLAHQISSRKKLSLNQTFTLLFSAKEAVLKANHLQIDALAISFSLSPNSFNGPSNLQLCSSLDQFFIVEMKWEYHAQIDRFYVLSVCVIKKNRNFSSQSLFRDDQLFVRILDT